MKIKIAAVTIVAFAFASSLQAQIIAAWDFTGENQLATSAADGYSVDLDSSNLLTRGPGALASAGANSFRTTGFQNDGISVANTDYFEFSLSATAGNTLSLTTINIRVTGTGTFVAAPGVMQQFAFSLDGVNFTLIGSPVITIGTNQTASFDLSIVPGLQNVPDSTTITLRYYASGQTTTGGYGFFSDVAGNFGLSVIGTGVAPIPEPSTYAIMLVGAGMLFGMQRLHRKTS